MGRSALLTQASSHTNGNIPRKPTGLATTQMEITLSITEKRRDILFRETDERFVE